jgi:putative phosphoribosyl transferase
MTFEDRRDAGQRLTQLIRNSSEWKAGEWYDAIALGLPRGGVPVAYEVAHALSLPLDVFVVRKLGVPGEEELAMGALASGGTLVMNLSIVQRVGISKEEIDEIVQREEQEIARREKVYREGHAPAGIEGRAVILVDDGLATGASMLAAVRALRMRARQVIVAVPVGEADVCGEVHREAGNVLCVTMPHSLLAISRFYRNFAQMPEEEVCKLLAKARSEEEDRWGIQWPA